MKNIENAKKLERLKGCWGLSKKQGVGLKAEILIIIVMIIILVSSKIEVWLYPIKYEEEVNKYCTMYNVETALVQAVMKEESKFNERALSASGAVGLMQIMPETGDWIAYTLHDKPGDLYEVERNIRYGTWYLAELTNEFGGNKVLALSAYNAGRGTVWDWIEEFAWDKSFDEVNEIPYPETRDYVKRVLRSYEKYKKSLTVDGEEK